ncbi:50S ribosomal protein L9 [Timonella senegalensis]|jgi:large subunit ribosomal protein L9|uniref:50S ribosomal protein L9 n=1 Tax=Timonella senegalensis TaxID=1465825 RepID=UPI0028AC4A2C|nr:50S ribosomal protein L9 [Timonella senegalensis]
MAKLILTHEVHRLGEPGDVVEVKDGYARNYLIPRSLATPWTKGAEAQIEAIRRARKSREIANLDEARALRDTLQSKTFTISATAGKGGRLFGSISTADIAAAVEAEGLKIDRRKVQIPAPIKATGTHNVIARLHPEVDAKIKVVVSAS